MKKIALIVITYNRPADMLELAKNISLLNGVADLLEEVIIVNNKSTESYQELVEFIAAHPEIPFKYIESSENLGVSRGRNYAIQQSKAPIFVLIDDDAEFKEYCITIMVVFNKQHSRINHSKREKHKTGLTLIISLVVEI